MHLHWRVRPMPCHADGFTASGDADTARDHEEMLSEARFNKPSVISVSQSPQTLIISTKRIEKHKGGLN